MKMLLLTVVLVCELVAAARILSDFQKKEHKCGVVASSNPLHQHPWLVHFAIEVDSWRGMKYTRRCGGSLISSRHVVTAAHCVTGVKLRSKRITARLGEYDLNRKVDCVSGVCGHLPIVAEVASIIVHDQYDGKGNDISVLTLAKDMPYTETIRPVCLPSGRINSEIVFSASGWGEDISRGVYAHVKKHLDLSYWPREKCQKAYKYLELPKDIVCAGGEQGVDTCRGDSGGPLVWKKRRHELWGVTSTGNVKCGTKGTPGIYTSVSDHVEWIRGVIGKKV